MLDQRSGLDSHCQGVSSPQTLFASDIGGGAGGGVGRGQVPGTSALTACQGQSLLLRRGTLSLCHEAPQAP